MPATLRATGRTRSGARERATRRAVPRPDVRTRARACRPRLRGRRCRSLRRVPARIRCSMSAAQLGKRVELAGGAGELVVDRRQHLLVDVLDRHVHCRRTCRPRARTRRAASRRRSRRRAPVRSRRSRRPDPSSTTVSDWLCAGLAGEVDDDRVALVRRPVVGGRQLGDRLSERVELRLDELLGDLGLGARHLERRPVDDLRRRLHLDGRSELPRLLGRSRQLVVVVGHGDGSQPRARGGVPEPAADVAVDRLRADPVATEAREEHLLRHLPLAEAGDLDAPAIGRQAACSTACSSSCGETSTVRRTRLSPSWPFFSHLGHARIQAVALARLAGDMPRRRLRVRGARAATRAPPARGARRA